MREVTKYMLVAFVLLAFSTSFASADLVGAWLFDGGSLADASGNGHDGEIAEGAPTQAGGKYGDAMEFFGADMVTVADDDALDLASFTLAAWINVDGQSGKWQIVASNLSLAGDFSVDRQIVVC